MSSACLAPSRRRRRTRGLVVPGRRFPSTAGMDSGEINTRVSGALCGRRSEGTAFASCSARRTRGSSGKHENGKKTLSGATYHPSWCSRVGSVYPFGGSELLSVRAGRRETRSPVRTARG